MYYFIMLEAMAVLLLVYFLFFLTSYKISISSENLTSYECGFDLISSARNLFSYRFFLISILFLIFDVEIALMLPIPYFSSMVMSMTFLSFLLILIGGLLYEYSYGVLEWL
uniref:NADH-ubiquinone oxidoreductase chain 3 n=1 Tax=Linyphia triangularis TaxID=94031 RepID=A0A7L7RZU8_LINTI|nr:NADH dehydrogenase subunit 3 [Linyphia triangularis]